MNCIELFALKSKESGESVAFATLDGKSCSFLELRERIGRVQTSLLKRKFKAGDAVLIATGPSIDLYAAVIAILGLGGSIVLVEPWMPVSRIAEVIRLVRPQVFISGPMGIFWGMRVKEIRDIPEWVRISQLLKEKSDGLIVTEVDPKTPGIITFTSGTSGAPKGVVREQGYLLDQFTVLKNSLHTDKFSGSDLCIFANWTLLNLAQGKSTVFFPAKWSAKNFSLLEEAAVRYKIETLTAGPAFAAELLKMKPLPHLKDFHIGGALTPNKLFQQLFSHYPETQFVQLYGSSEVEPVCAVDARLSVQKSLEKNYFHALYLGDPIPEISFENKSEGMWVSGAHVCPFYLNNKRENELNKRKDADGKIWHFMGDRIHVDEEKKWWYQGRSQLPACDFQDEQRLYQLLGHDRAFLHREGERLLLIGEKVKGKKAELKTAFPLVSECHEVQIKKDIRHRARIDRKASTKKIKLG
jgi:acyl-coenzyme A synthetase/AMP-(fatty) acid ligase